MPAGLGKPRPHRRCPPAASRLLRGSRSGYGAAKAEWHGKDLNALEPEEMEHLLADTVLKEFKLRLGRIGIRYQSPARP